MNHRLFFFLAIISLLIIASCTKNDAVDVCVKVLCQALAVTITVVDVGADLKIREWARRLRCKECISTRTTTLGNNPLPTGRNS